MNAFGNVNALQSTSYAGPIVARYLAGLDQTTAGRLSREALRALAIHHAASSEQLNSTHLTTSDSTSSDAEFRNQSRKPPTAMNTE